MKPPVDPELRKLDALIHKKLFKDEPHLNGGSNPPHFTTNEGLAFKVLRRVCDGGAAPRVCSRRYATGCKIWWLEDFYIQPPITGKAAPTLELAICQFAETMFTV